MLKVLTVILVLVACCHCSDNEVLVEDARASKKKKNALKLWAMILFVIFSKVAVFKVASFMFFYMIFQKIFYLGGIALTYYMRQKTEKPTTPPITYGPPADYNTVGYSYGPPGHPESSNIEQPYPGSEYGVPSLREIGGSFNNWLTKINTQF